MAKSVDATSVVKGVKPIAVMALGFMGGVSAQKVLNKFILGSETVKGLLGEDTANNLKQYLSPAIVTATSIIIGMKTKDDMVKHLAIGAGTSGVATVGFKLLWDKDLLGSLNGGLLGNLLGEDPEDFEGFEGFEGEETEENVLPMGAFSTPLPAPPIRDTNFERETVVNGFGSANDGLIL